MYKMITVQNQEVSALWGYYDIPMGSNMFTTMPSTDIFITVQIAAPPSFV